MPRRRDDYIKAGGMRTVVVLMALAAAALLTASSPRADVVCVERRFSFVPNGVTYVAGRTRAGQPCQIGFGLFGGNVEALRITVRPSHGVLGLSGQEANRRYVAYAPSAGFIGQDRFELHLQVTPVGRASSLITRVRVEMNVTP